VIVHSRIDGPQLAGNLLGDPSERDLFVYLPPGYEESDARYPVAYLLHALGMMDRHIETDDASVAVADHDRTLDPQLVHQLDRVLGHVVVVERTIDEVGGAPMPHLLRGDHPKVRREQRNPLLGDRGCSTVEEHQRGPVAVNLVVQGEAVDRGVGHTPHCASGRPFTAIASRGHGCETRPRRRGAS